MLDTIDATQSGRGRGLDRAENGSAMRGNSSHLERNPDQDGEDGKENGVQQESSVAGSKISSGSGSSGKAAKRSQFLVEKMRSTLRQIGAVSDLSEYLDQHLEELFVDGNRAPELFDIRTVIVNAWIEEVLRFLTIKVIAKDVQSPCVIRGTKPIDIAMRGLMDLPNNAYGELCYQLGVSSGIIEHDFEDLVDDDVKMNAARLMDSKRRGGSSQRQIEEERQRAYTKKKREYKKTIRVYEHCFEQDDCPDLYWPEPKRPQKESLIAILAETLDVKSDFANEPGLFVKEIFQNGCKSHVFHQALASSSSRRSGGKNTRSRKKSARKMQRGRD